MVRWIHRGVIVTCGVALGLAAAAACVIADPPAALPVIPIEAPRILHDSTVPQTTKILTAWPSSFNVYVEASPTSIVKYQFFVDYDPQQGAYAQFIPGQLDAIASGADAGIRPLPPIIASQPVAPGCHTVELLVALDFEANHTPDPSSGGDSVSWIYTSNGLEDGCQVYVGPDAGPDAGDASAGAGEGGD